MKITVNRQLETAKEYLKVSDFHLAINILNSLDIREISETMIGEYYLIKSECLLNLGDFNHDYPDRAITLFKKSSQHDKYALAKYFKGWQLQSLGESIHAKSTLTEAYAAALRAEDSVLAGNSLSKLAYILHKSGNIDQALENINKCIDIDIEAGQIEKAEKMKNNRARLYISCGQFNNALTRFKECENKDNNDDLDAISLHSVLMSHSIVQAYCGNFDKAFELITKCQNIPEKYDRLRVIYFEYNGHILMLNGQYNKALASFQNGLKLANKLAPKSDMTSQIQRLIAEVYLHLNQFDYAQNLASDSLKISEQIDEKVEISACYRIFAQLEHQKGNNDKAKEYFTKSIELFNSIDSYYELAVTQFKTAKSYLFSDYDTLDMLYEARRYFKSENINHYLNKVDREISRLKNISVKTSNKLTSNINECPIIITADKTMKNLLALTKEISVAADTVLITGDTGTGKELLAQYLHYHSGRIGKFITVNSATIPESIFESELFGYDKGAFTGADKSKKGKFELAENGTLFLDEIGEIPLLLQAKLLRVLEENKVERLGSVEKRPLNVRVIVATNKDLLAMVEKNKFRADLYYRLKVLTLHLTPLQEREGDIPLLVEYFLQNFGFQTNGDAKIIEQLANLLSEQQWDGNIRELRNELKRLYLFADKSIEKMIELINEQHPSSEKESLIATLKLTNGRTVGKRQENLVSVKALSDTVSRNIIFTILKTYNLYRLLSFQV